MTQYQALFDAGVQTIKIGQPADSEPEAWELIHAEAMSVWPHNARLRRVFEECCSVGRVIPIMQ
jgi:hypothetical protein